MLQILIWCDNPDCMTLFRAPARCTRDTISTVTAEARRNGWMTTRDANARAIELCPACAGSAITKRAVKYNKGFRQAWNQSKGKYEKIKRGE
jgi:hypothetical protein